jgi:hypothetical protein
MTPAEIIRTWGENDSVIFCVRVPIERSDAACELCEHWIAALPSSRMKGRQPGWHLVCKECLNKYFPEMRERGGVVKFGGRFKTEDEAKKVLPE